MSKKVVVKVVWSIKKPLEMASFALGTVSAMKKHNEFLSPDVPLDVMTNAANRVQTGYAERKNGIVAADNLSTAINQLNNFLHIQAEFVNKVANGHADIIHNAGFETISDIRGAGLKPNKAGSVSLTPIKGGGMKAQLNKVKGATNYCFLLVTNDVFDITVVNGEIFIPSGTTVRIINTTKRTAVFKNLKPMIVVHVAVIASNASGDNGFSPVAYSSTLM